MVLPLLAWVLLLTVAACDKDDEEVMEKLLPRHLEPLLTNATDMNIVG